MVLKSGAYVLSFIIAWLNAVKMETENHSVAWRVQMKIPVGVEARSFSFGKLAENIAAELGISNVGQIGDLDGYFLFHLKHNISSDFKIKIASHPNINWYREDLYLQRAKRTYRGAHYPYFSDPLFPAQWHLKNLKANHYDCNVSGVWMHNITGKGVVVAVVDDGVEWSHPDLIDNYCKEGSIDLNSNDDDPTPVYDKDENNKHGTRCAGEIAAVPNAVCGVGIAYGAKFSGIRVLDGPTTDSTEATAFNKHMNVNDVYSCSWGPEDDGKTVDGPHEMGLLALSHGAVAGRKGFGSIFVVASGNGGENDDNCNFDGYANSLYTITIGAVDEYGKKPSYAEECVSMLACTVSSGSGYSRNIVTTDWTLGKSHTKDQCTISHSGTSAATPLAAGMIALMLEVRPCLSWRDVQHIIAMTGRKINPGQEWVHNKAGYSHSNIYGFGLLDSWKLVNAAKIWESIPWLTSVTANTDKNKNIEIPQSSLTVQAEVPLDDCQKHLLSSLEYVVFSLNIDFNIARGNVEYILICPSGTQSLIPARKSDTSKKGLKEWSFTTAKCWGESPAGMYKLKIISKLYSKTDPIAILKSWKLTLYGSKWTQSEMKDRRVLIGNSMHGNLLSSKENFTSNCPQPQMDTFDVTTTLTERTIKLLSMISCFIAFWAVYYSLEITFCEDSDEKKDDQTASEASDSRQSQPQISDSFL